MRYDITTDDTRFLIPVYSALGATASTSLNVVQQELVTMNYDVSFNIDLCAYTDGEVRSGHILNGFKLYLDGTELKVDMRTDPNYQSAFEAELVQIINQATDKNGKTLSWMIYDDSLAHFKAVYGDNIANILESEWGLTVNLDAPGGAHNMWNDLNLKSAARLLLAEQIPNTTYRLYTDHDENMITNAMPLHDGDVLGIFFNLTLKTIAQEVKNVQGQSPDACANPPSIYRDGLTVTGPYGTPYNPPTGGFIGDSNTGVIPSFDSRDIGSVTDIQDNWNTISSLSDSSMPPEGPGFTYSQQIVAFFVKMCGSFVNPCSQAQGLVGTLVGVDSDYVETGTAINGSPL